jgi:hypothetical protein
LPWPDAVAATVTIASMSLRSPILMVVSLVSGNADAIV